MHESKLDLETYMVAPVFRDRLFRVNPAQLTHNFQPMGELDEEDISEIVKALFTLGFLTPVLVDSDGVIIAGQGLVEAAVRIGLDDIPALRLEGLNAEERSIYFRMTHQFFKTADLDREIFQIEVQHILSFTVSGRLTMEIQASQQAS